MVNEVEIFAGRTRARPEGDAPAVVAAHTKVGSSHFYAMGTKFRTLTQRLFQ